MLKTKYIELFKKVRMLPLDTACAPFLAYLCFGYRQLLLLSYTDPGFTSDFGEEAQPLSLTGIMLQVLDKLAENLNQELVPREWARNIVYLLEALTFQYGGKHMLVARNAMQDFFCTRKGEQQEQEQEQQEQEQQQQQLEGDICKMLCYQYYFRSDSQALKQARGMIDGWVQELSADGLWKDLTPARSLERLEAMALFADTADHEVYKKQTDTLIHHFSRTEDLENKVRFLLIAVQAGMFSTYKERIKEITEEALELNLTEGDFVNMRHIVGIEDDLVYEGNAEALQTEQSAWKTNKCNEAHLLQAVRFHMLGMYWLGEK
ncbi:MAG: hypothetical protein GX877_01490 [Bacteroidales bacterium]|nr:hypothetical protein [Bacteroidales bacterium]